MVQWIGPGAFSFHVTRLPGRSSLRGLFGGGGSGTLRCSRPPNGAPGRQFLSETSGALATTMTCCRLLERARQHAETWKDQERIHCEKRSYSYRELIQAADELSAVVNPILTRLRTQLDTNQPRLGFCLPANFSYLTALFCAWSTNCIAVPLHPKYPEKEIEYVVDDSRATLLVCTEETRSSLQSVAERSGRPLLTISADSASVLDVFDDPRDGGAAANAGKEREEEGEQAMLIYTSGTTGKPKGVVWTHGMFAFQMETLSKAWRWSRDDRIINFLPLHHVHGINNIVGSALWNGAHLEMLEKFQAEHVWDRICSPLDPPSVFMAVPTIYARMIAEFEARPSPARREAASKLRLFVSGSAALQNIYFRRWLEISGQIILERYGMSEVGMALSNHYDGERREGWVGTALPGVETKVMDVETCEEITEPVATGELLLSGPGVFTHYWDRPDATWNSFDAKTGFFCTGDVVERDAEGWFRILGRRSVDIIKSGGYKISALEIEREVLEHPDVAQIAVVGVADEEFGQVVGALIVLQDGVQGLESKELQKWCKERLASYKIPRIIKIADEIPRNAMGKVEKNKVMELF